MAAALTPVRISVNAAASATVLVTRLNPVHTRYNGDVVIEHVRAAAISWKPRSFTEGWMDGRSPDARPGGVDEALL